MKKKQLLLFLQNIDSTITNIEFGANSIILCNFKDRKLPLWLVGEAFRLYLALYLRMEHLKNSTKDSKVLLLDEIENGIHYSLFPQFISFLFKQAKENDLQIFVTTHSYEILEQLSTYLKENKSEQASYLHLKTKDNVTCSTTYNREDIINTVKNTIELR